LIIMKPMNKTSRRRFIGICAAMAGLGALRASPGAWAMMDTQPVIWRGIALGADAELRIHHPDRAAAHELVKASIAEVRRMEKLFSLYMDDSAISELNRTGRLAHPEPDMTALLDQARSIAHLTGGAFDPTVQPLWSLYAAHFSRPDADPDGPSSASLRAALDLVDYRKLSLDTTHIALSRAGMQMTLNGIAQGYITDRIVQMLQAAGLDRALVDMGEIRGLTRNPASPAWRAGLADPSDSARLLETVELRNQALSTSSGFGTPFDPPGRHHHIFDPRTGRSPARYRNVSVSAATAAMADALSTAFCSMSLEDTQAIVRRHGLKAWFALPDGRLIRQG